MKLLSYVPALVVLILGLSQVHGAPIDDLNSPLDGRGNENPTLPSGEKAPKVDLGFLEPTGKKLPELAAATEAFRAGKVADAEALLEAAEESYPNLPPARLMLARMFFGAGDRTRGRLLMEQVAAKHPRHPEVYLAFGNLALSEGRLADAMLHFQAAVSVKPPAGWPKEQVEMLSQNSLIGQVNVWERRGEWLVAASLLKKLLVIRSNEADLRDRYGADLFLAGQEREAYEQFGISFRLNGRMNRPEVSMAVMFTRQQDYTQANRWFERAIAKHPKEPKIHFEYSSALLMQDQAQKAKVHGDQAAELGMTGPGLWMQRGLTAQQLGDYKAAEELFEHYLQVSPSHFEAMNQLALVLAEQSDPNKKKRAAQLALLNARQYPRSPQAVTTLAWVTYRRGNTQEAQRLLLSAAKAGNVSPDTIFYLAQVISQAGDEANSDTMKNLNKSLRDAVDRPGLFVLRPQIREWLKQHAG